MTVAGILGAVAGVAVVAALVAFVGVLLFARIAHPCAFGHPLVRPHVTASFRVCGRCGWVQHDGPRPNEAPR